MRATILALLALTACDICEPNQDSTDAPADAEYAADFIREEWSARLGVNAELPPITWYEGECLTWTYLPEPHDCTRGIYFPGVGPTDEQIEILADRPAIWDTSLAHELLHWTLQRTTGDLDADHSGPAWDQVLAVRQALADSMQPDSVPVESEPSPPRSDADTIAQ